jgi:serine protease Do
MLILTIVMVLATASIGSTTQASPVAALTEDLPDRVAKVLPGVINISSSSAARVQIYGWNDFMRFWGIPQERKQTSLGSGFIIDKNGFAITNNHVIAHADAIRVTLIDKHTYRARLVGTDQKMDIALIQIRDDKDKVPPNLSPVKLGDSDKTRIAEPVFAVGNPFGLQHTVTMGIISAKNRTIGMGPFDNFLQTDASINPGNSGGPLFNLKGEVVGINSVIYSRTGQSGGLGFAIPINEAKKILGDLKRYGRVPRPWLGILGERVTPALADYYGLGVSHGVLVYNLVQSAPADDAGLRQGDVIVELDGEKADEPNDLERQLATHRPTDSIQVKIRRGRRDRTIRIKLEELPRMDELPPGII